MPSLRLFAILHALVTTSWLVQATRTTPPHGTPAQAAIGPVRCYARVIDETAIAYANARWLCRGAPSDAPARCFAAARGRTALLETEAVRLCRGSSSMGPVECAVSGFERLALSNRELVQLCAGVDAAPGRSP